MNSWVEALRDVEDMRRRCEEHGREMAANPEAAEFARYCPTWSPTR